MKRIREDFKKMLSGLSYQNSGGNLSRREKVALLDNSSKIQKTGNKFDLKTALHKVVSPKTEVSDKSVA